MYVGIYGCHNYTAAAFHSGMDVRMYVGIYGCHNYTAAAFIAVWMYVCM